MTKIVITASSVLNLLKRTFQMSAVHNNRDYYVAVLRRVNLDQDSRCQPLSTPLKMLGLLIFPTFAWHL